ncbi:unnamed protein product [Linum trigynum]|uniref:Uncharacterized protein n=1 Tax=Linum trigynum TaxID=586398 RepID=A0AAV2FQQ1_9ROSI
MASADSLNPVTQVQLELCHIPPALPPSDDILTFPLTVFDLYWFRTPPVERLFFYPLPPRNSTLDFFTYVLLPSLKLSLSATLSHFLPLAATLTWPVDSPKPFLLYAPSSSAVGGVPLTVSQSAADFHHLASDVSQIRSADLSRPFVPVLPSTDSSAAVVALQITLFPGQGFCVGMTCHHAVLDGKSASLFFKAWAHSSKFPTAALPQELTPFLDRSFVVHDPDDMGRAYLDCRAQPGNPDRRSLKLPRFTFAPELVRATFLLSRERLQTLRQRAMMTKTTTSSSRKMTRLSSFVLTFAHSIVCIVKAKRLSAEGVVHVGFMADARGRLRPSLPANYLGNCLIGKSALMEVKPLLEEEEEEGGGMGFAVERISGMIDELEEEGGRRLTEIPSTFDGKMEASRGVFIGVAGSPRFGLYEADFGWGKPKHVEVTSAASISMAECRDGSNGIEVGLALIADQMDFFSSSFAG